MKFRKGTWTVSILVIAGVMTLSSDAAWGTSAPTVSVTFTVDPALNLAAVGDTITASASATFSADALDEAEDSAGGQVHYRFKWDYNGDDGSSNHWTAWSTSYTSAGSGSYSSSGNKTIRVTVEAAVMGPGAYRGLSAYDDEAEGVTVFKVKITTPATFPVSFPSNGNLQMGCTVTPAEATGGTYRWSKTGGPGTGTFSDPTSQNPSFSVDEAGSYSVKVVYTKNPTDEELAEGDNAAEVDEP